MQFVNVIKPGSKVLIVGGGTGDILNRLLASTQNIRIDFIEPSAAMIKIAEKRLLEHYAHSVNFINDNHTCIESAEHYDVVMVFFVLDVFKQEESLEVLKKITGSLKHEGIILFADFFTTTNIFHRLLVWMMYRFFKLTTGIIANKLPDYETLLRQCGLLVTDEKHFMKGLVRSQICIKAK